MKGLLFTVIATIATLGCSEDAEYNSSDAGTNQQGMTSDCTVYFDANATYDGDGTSWSQAISSMVKMVEIVGDRLGHVDNCDVLSKDISDVDALDQALAPYKGRITVKSDSESNVSTGGTPVDASSFNAPNSTGGNSDSASGNSPISTVNIPSITNDTGILSDAPNLFNQDSMDYTSFAACSCDTFSGRVEMSATTDASGTTNTGVLEIGNGLRIDNNEIITNTNSNLYLQSDNNGDLRVDGSTLAVDSSANRVGIGTTAPTKTLDVNGDIAMKNAVFESWSNPNASGIRVKTYAFQLTDSSGNIYASFGGPDGSMMVYGGITAEELTLQANLADYVFEKGYDLKSLDEVEKYIEANNHLPGVPSASEVNAQGFSVADFNNLLLEKVEELTLHLIEQNKKVSSQSEEIKRLQKEMASLK